MSMIKTSPSTILQSYLSSRLLQLQLSLRRQQENTWKKTGSVVVVVLVFLLGAVPLHQVQVQEDEG